MKSTLDLKRLFAGQRTAGPHLIAPNLRMYLLKQRGRYSKIIPTIAIERRVNGISRPIKVSVNRDTLAPRFRRMVEAYCEHFELCDMSKEILLHRLPAFEIFTEYLLPMERASGSISEAEASRFSDIHNGHASPTFPSFEQFREAEEMATCIRAHVSFHTEFLTLFRQSDDGQTVLCSYPYLCGDVASAVNAAARQIEAVEESGKAKRRSKHPADFVRYYVDSVKDRGSYVVNHPNARTRTFSFALNEARADGSLHAYRSALQYAAHLIFEPVPLDVEHWRLRRLYEPGHQVVKGHVWDLPAKSNRGLRPGEKVKYQNPVAKVPADATFIAAVHRASGPWFKLRKPNAGVIYVRHSWLLRD